MYTDDVFVIASPEIVEANFCADAEEWFGDTEIKAVKTLRGTHVDIRGSSTDVVNATAQFSRMSAWAGAKCHACKIDAAFL